MGCRVGSQRVGGEAFAWHRGGWHRGGACVQWVGMVGLEHCVEVARFSHSGWGCGGACMLWQDLCATLGWGHGEVFMGQVGVEVRLACHVGTASEQCHSESCAL